MIIITHPQYPDLPINPDSMSITLTPNNTSPLAQLLNRPPSIPFPDMSHRVQRMCIGVRVPELESVDIVRDLSITDRRGLRVDDVREGWWKEGR
jgi:hypothetical protein